MDEKKIKKIVDACGAAISAVLSVANEVTPAADIKEKPPADEATPTAEPPTDDEAPKKEGAPEPVDMESKVREALRILEEIKEKEKR